MADQKLVSFIQEALKKGNSRAQIEQVLLQKGWKLDQVQDAFVAASTPLGTSPAKITPQKKSLLKNPLFILFLILLFLLVGTGIAYWYVTSSSGCSSNSDCGAGYSCQNGNCVKTGCTSDSDCSRGQTCTGGSCVPVSTAECSLDSDCAAGESCISGSCVLGEIQCTSDAQCTSGFACSPSQTCYDTCTTSSGCADGYECSSGSCTEVSVAQTSSSGEENYIIKSATLSGLTTAASSYGINISHEGTLDSHVEPFLTCTFLSSEGSILNSTSFQTGSLNLNETNIETCTLDSDTVYASASTDGNVTILLNATVDSYNDVNESNEMDNTLLQNFTFFLSDFSVSSSLCTSDSDCASGETCDTDSTSSTYGSCISIPVSVLGSSCTDDSTCEGYVCSQDATLSEYHTCIACTSSDLDACALGFACHTDSTSSDFHTCYTSCSDDSNCASGYVCNDASTCVSEASITSTTPACSDGVDNDGDGYYDYSGACLLNDGVTVASCDNTTFSAAFGSESCETYCTTNLLAYYSPDSGCISASDLSETADCNDGLDNNGDGYIDYSGGDPGCASTYDYSENYACQDHIDNDFDGKIDYPSDTGCSCGTDNYEDNSISEVTDCITIIPTTTCDPSSVPTCADGIDNDGDGKIDLADTECSTWTDDEAGASSSSCTSDTDCSLGFSCDTDTSSSTYGQCVPTNSCPDGYTSDSSGTCVADTSIACNDGLDNNGDLYADYYGACDTDKNGLPDTSCTEMLDPTFFASLTDVPAYCKYICESYYSGTYYPADSACTAITDTSESCTSSTDCGSGQACTGGICADSTCADGVDNNADGTLDYSGAIYLGSSTGSSLYSCDGTIISVFSTLTPDNGVLAAALQGKNCEEQCSVIQSYYGSTAANGYKYISQCTYYPPDSSCTSAVDIEGGVCTDNIDNNGNGDYDYLGACDTNSDGIPDQSCITTLYIHYLSEGYTPIDALAYIASANGTTCSYICTNYDSGTYFSADSQCGSSTDSNEGTAGTLNYAPEQTKQQGSGFPDFLSTVVDFFLRTQPVAASCTSDKAGSECSVPPNKGKILFEAPLDNKYSSQNEPQSPLFIKVLDFFLHTKPILSSPQTKGSSDTSASESKSSG